MTANSVAASALFDARLELDLNAQRLDSLPPVLTHALRIAASPRPDAQHVMSFVQEVAQCEQVLTANVPASYSHAALVIDSGGDLSALLEAARSLDPSEIDALIDSLTASDELWVQVLPTGVKIEPVVERLIDYAAATESANEDVDAEEVDRMLSFLLEVIREQIGNARAEVTRIARNVLELKSLYLRDNNLHELPDEICKLTRLCILDLSGNSFRDLPRDVLRLPRLQVLDLSRNSNLESLPPTRPRFVRHLKGFDASSCALEALPDWLCECDRLLTLELSNNALRSLPERIGDLSSLELLNLDDNSLEELPENIGGLRSLEALDLSRNLLRELPESIGLLVELGLLLLEDNRIATLPLELSNLNPEMDIDLRGNPLPDTTLRVAMSGTETLFEYLRSLGSDTRPCREAKLVLIGEGNRGKTCVVGQLTEGRFIERPWTHGLEISQVEISPERASKRSNDAPVLLHIWDFGGQKVFKLTHQFFFSQDAVYLVVWRTREGFVEGGGAAGLASIRRRLGNSATIMLVTSYADDDPPANIPLESLQHEYYPMLKGAWSVDSRSGSGFAELRSAIYRYSSDLNHINDPIATSWLAVRDRLHEIDQPYISYDRYLEISGEEGLTDGAAEAWAQLMHILGDVIYLHGDLALGGTIVLDPEILARAVAALINERDLVGSGIVDHSRMVEAWTLHNPELGKEAYPFLLALMERYDICYRVDNGKASLVAPLLSEERPLSIPFEAEDPLLDRQRQMVLEAEFEADVPALIAWLTVRNHRWSTEWMWRDGVVFEQEIEGSVNRALIESSTRGLRMVVRGSQPSELFSRLRGEIEYLLSERWPHTTLDLYVPCGQSIAHSYCPGRFRYRALANAHVVGVEELQCQECRRFQSVRRLVNGLGTPNELFEPSVRFTEIVKRLDLIQDSINRQGDRAEQLEEIVQGGVADLRVSVRQIQELVNRFASDTPRIFSVIELKGAANAAQFWRAQYGLQLWCEQPGEWHAFGEPYRFTRPREWFEKAAPVLRLVGKALQVAGVAGVVAPGSGGAALDLANRVDRAARVGVVGDGVDDQSTEPAGAGRIVQEYELRVLKELLLDVDPPPQQMAGLQQVVSDGGLGLWVCPAHKAQYTSELPSLDG